MSALAEALVAAQRRALSAMEKQYAAGRLEADDARALMNSFGLTDAVDQDRLLAALETIRVYGAPLPSENGGEPKPPEPATEPQWTLIRRLCDDKSQPVPDRTLSKQDAHEVINELKAGSYDPAKWTVPF